MPTIPEALDIGWQRHQAGDLRAAESVYRQVLAVAPENANAWCFLGMICHDQRRYDEAVEAYRRALEIRPEFPVALSNLGNTLKQQGKLDEAIASCRLALQHKPDYATAHNNLGVALVAQGKLEAAAESFERALQLMPGDAVAQANLGAALVRQGRFDEGTSHSREALKINPNYAEAHKNQAIVWLLLGDFERGWPEYEWRWQCPGLSLPNTDRPRWDGSSLAGKTLLLHAEQGLGDTIQFMRYARLLRTQANRIVAAVQKPLLRLLAECQGVDQWATTDEPLPAHDVFIPLMSLPGVLHTDLGSIPSDTPYLQANASLESQWRERLAEWSGFKVGIAWQGSPDFHADRHRSIPLSFFEPLSQIDNVTLFCLQKGHGRDQLEELPDSFRLVDFGAELDEESGPFMDTAAIVKNLDLIITSDTSVTHLAGALAVPTWVALSASPDWRWLLEREDTPWYPTLRLFRQTEIGEWRPVFERITTELREAVSTGAVSTGVRVTKPPPAASAQIGASEPSGFNVLRECRHGTMLFNRHDMYIGKSLELYGEYSEGEVQMFQRLLSAGDLVIEAGANIGAHTVPLAIIVGDTGRVIGFEPQRILFQTLCANVALSSLTNVDCHLAAVGAEPGEIVVPPLDYTRTNNFGGLGLGMYQHGERVPLVTLDALPLAHCRLLKIDVEGMEQEVLAGAGALLAEHRPLLYVENDREEKSRDLIQSIRDLGYRLYWHTPHLFNPDNYRRHSTNAFANIISKNMLGVPAESALRCEDLESVT